MIGEENPEDVTMDVLVTEKEAEDMAEFCENYIWAFPDSSMGDVMENSIYRILGPLIYNRIHQAPNVSFWEVQIPFAIGKDGEFVWQISS